ncbi:MAG: hypothetical protein ABGX53_05985 [Candidatus Thioglobus sp.]
MDDADGQHECVRTLAEPKEDYTLIVTGNSSSIKTDFPHPIYLKKDRSYELALTNLETYYSFPNVDSTNNTFNFSKDSGKTWQTVKIPIGCYEIDAINTEIIRQIGNNSITIKPNRNTLQSILSIANNYAVDFSMPNCLASVLGFDPKIYKSGTHTSEHIVNILRVNSILVHSNIVSGSYLAGRQQPVIYSFFPNVAPGVKIIVTPTNLTYCPITVDTISTLTSWLTDQNYEPINLRGETLTIRLHLRER